MIIININNNNQCPQLDEARHDRGPHGQNTRPQHRQDLCVWQDRKAGVPESPGPGAALRKGAFVTWAHQNHGGPVLVLLKKINFQPK